MITIMVMLEGQYSKEKATTTANTTQHSTESLPRRRLIFFLGYTFKYSAQTPRCTPSYNVDQPLIIPPVAAFLSKQDDFTLAAARRPC